MEVLQDTYKDTKIGRIPKDWELLSVEKCILKKKFSVGKLPKKDYFVEGRFPIIDQSKTFIIGYSNDSELLYNGNLPAIIYGDHTNHVKYISFPFICGADGVKIIQPLDELDNKFVYYSILYRKPQSEGYKRHFSILKEKHLCIPPLPEQQKIAAILSTVDEQISNTDKIIEKSKELKKGLMQKLFSEGIGHTEFKDTKIGRIPKDWQVDELTNLSKITRLAGYEYSEYWQESEDGEIFALRGYNIGKNKISYNKLSKISNELSLQLSRSRLSINDVVFPCVGTIGNAVVIKEDNKFHINQNIAKITPNDSLDSDYLVQYLMSYLCIKEIFKFNASSSQPNVLVGSLRKFKLPVPTIPEQQKIAAILSEADAKIEKEQTQKAQLEALKKGLMQQLLTGKKRVKV